ncbi:FKBP-type peptidyl-prolyl cis-trans isomerase [Lysobacter sp. A03]|uniref:FKBP-type peptidyl-prolyl cis-trans isomerase n=1 Tax=Lysobacter sp. A03 TaxID=1199154 RepID=UPI0005B7168C|nr:FKBP-type peptidyl-prolyl cis-trans isomerase [Lysobacter sp. A03]KIQ95931.1 FKBP-type peptidyl-prolyl cis-trans isomerase FkpA precursor [Lysobacter sp. A03]
MIHFPRTALLAASMAFALVACQADDKATPKTDAADSSTVQGQPLKIKGLATEKEQVSYMIGLDLAKALEQVKDEVDVDTLAKAIKTELDGGESLMTDEQAAQVAEAFGQKLQAKRAADAAAIGDANKAEGEAFLAENAKKPGVVVTDSGLQYQVLEEGTGPKPTVDDVVTVHYKGTLLDGETFDSSYDRGEPTDLPLQQVVPGWQEGIVLMPVGSKYRFWIPSELGYGEIGTPGGAIGPNAALVFEVELLDIVKDNAGE